MSESFYITTPIYYVNAEPHIGHAYTTVVADTLARWHRLLGHEVRFQTGTDEHGEKVVEAAQAANLDVKDYVDAISGKFRQAWERLGIGYDHFIRTTQAQHMWVVRNILDKVNAAGDIYFSEYSGHYCYGCERFVLERELVDGKCPDHLTVPTFVKEGNYFFRMSKYQDWLVGHITENPGFIRPERYRNEVLAFLKEPLEDLCISRPRARVRWGIPLPFDDDYVTYVWFDALINYVSGLGYPEGQLFDKYWPSCQHLIAKDILKPHGIYWPTMLKAAGIPPYQHLNVHGYWQVGHGKMSKSLGNVVEPQDLVARYGIDQVRYFFLREMVFGLDSSFSEAALIGRINADLANDLGNLFSRTISMVLKYRQGVVPEAGAPAALEQELQDLATAVGQDYVHLMPELEFHKALQRLWELINFTNRYIVASEPWKLFQEAQQQSRLDTVLYHLVEVLRQVTVMLLPVMPNRAAIMARQLAIQPGAQPLTTELRWGGFRPGGTVQRGEPLFPRLETETPVPKAPATKPPTPEVKPIKPEIELAAFQQIDLRIGLILAAEKVEKSDKLVKLQVDVGEVRQVVAGLAKSYQPEDLVGRRVILVANLKPAKLMGIESQGMVLAAVGEKDLCLVSPILGMPPGTPVS